MQYRADKFDTQVPDGWRDLTVHRFRSPDDEEQVSIHIELRMADIAIEQRLLEKTATVREGIPFAELVWTGDATVGPEPAKAFRVDGQRGDEVPLTYFAILARWGERRLLMIEYEGPTARFAAAEPMVRRIAASMRPTGA